jgi:hypothetical protein
MSENLIGRCEDDERGHQPCWLTRLEDEVQAFVEEGWIPGYYAKYVTTFLGMLEIEYIITPFVRVKKHCSVRLDWPKGSVETLEVVIVAENYCFATWRVGSEIKAEHRCTPLGLRQILLNFYPSVKNNFDTKFNWTGIV